MADSLYSAHSCRLREGSEKDKKIRLDPDLVRKLKILSAKRDMKVNRVLEEAIIDLLRKYREI